jgi:hypothetical protein
MKSNKRIDQLPASSNQLKTTDLIPIFSDGRTERVSVDGFISLLNTGTTLNTYTTGTTYNPNSNTLIVSRNDGSDLTTTIDTFSAITVTNTINTTVLSATTLYVNTVVISGVTTNIGDNFYVTGSTLNGNNLEIGRNGGLSDVTVDFTTLVSSVSGDTNISNTDLTLDGNRTHNLAGYDLVFSGGNVGIGNPTSNISSGSTFSVHAGGNGNIVNFVNSSYDPKFLVDDTGDVGLNTVLPTAQFEMTDHSDSDQLMRIGNSLRTTALGTTTKMGMEFMRGDLNAYSLSNFIGSLTDGDMGIEFASDLIFTSNNSNRANKTLLSLYGGVNNGGIGIGVVNAKSVLEIADTSLSFPTIVTPEQGIQLAGKASTFTGSLSSGPEALRVWGIEQSTFDNTSPRTATTMSSLWVQGAPLITSAWTVDNVYSLHVQSGMTHLGSGVQVVGDTESSNIFESTTNGGNTALVVDTLGDVGIGLDIPTSQFEIQDLTDTTQSMRIGNNLRTTVDGGTTKMGMEFKRDGSSYVASHFIGSRDDLSLGFECGAGGFNFTTWQGVTNKNRFLINGSNVERGFVSIGGSSPQSLLVLDSGMDGISGGANLSQGIQLAGKAHTYDSVVGSDPDALRVWGIEQSTFDNSTSRSTTSSSSLWIQGAPLVSSAWTVTNTYALDVESGVSHFGGDVSIGTTTPTDTLHINGVSGSTQFRLEKSYTPTSSSDTAGNIGSIAWDDDYMYIKTNTGWGRTTLDYGF